MSALDRIQRATLLDVKPGDLLLIEVAADAEISEIEGVGDMVRAELERIGSGRVGVIVAPRSYMTAKIVHPTE